MAANPPAKHHYIPEFYLRWWRGNDGRIERFTKPRNEVTVRRVPPSEIGWEKNLYASPETDTNRRQWLEQQFFRALDNLAAKVLFKLNGCVQLDLTAEERSVWALFIHSLLLRTPENLAAYKEGGKRALDEVLKDLGSVYAERRGPHDPRTYEEYIASRKNEDDERSVLGSLPQIIMNENIGNVLFSRTWRLIEVPPSERELLISDNPVTRTNGLLVQNGHIAMPLSPRRLLLIAGDDGVLDTVARMKSCEIVRNMNASTVGCARRFVGATDRHQERFIRNRFGNLEVLRLGHGTKAS